MSEGSVRNCKVKEDEDPIWTHINLNTINAMVYLPQVWKSCASTKVQQCLAFLQPPQTRVTFWIFLGCTLDCSIETEFIFSCSYGSVVAGTIWLVNVRCSGSEARLISCPANVFQSHNCSHSDDVAIDCSSGNQHCYCVIYYLLARWFIIREWAWAACIADLMFCHGTQTMGFVTVCCSVNMQVSKTLCSHFSGQRSTTATHTLGLNFTMKSWAESLTRRSVIMNGPYLKWTQLLCMIWRYRLWAACLCLSWSAVAFSRIGSLSWS